MNPQETLAALARAVERARLSSDSRAAGAGILTLAREISQARGCFLARVDGAGLRWVQGVGERGELAELPARDLERVSQAVSESLDGVADAPPSMTGGRAPSGAVAVKAEAGRPPVHAFPLVDPRTRNWEGVLGLLPDPSAPPELGETADAGLTILRSLLDPWMLHHSAEAKPDPARTPARKPKGPFKHSFDEIITRSEKLHLIFRKLDRVIGAKVPVLICGETGTGKELIARALHRNDPQRKGRRLYAQNCGAIPAHLLESELFGYEKGAFTGADQRKEGLFEIASGSTLFLDEIGEMSLDMQTRLLRVLQENEIVPLGANEPLKVDVRIVAATLRDLEADVKGGLFRQDLFYRLKVVRFLLPPLRERPEDIGLLIEHFLRKSAREMGRPPKVLDRRDPRLMEALERYAWPGNVRELENVVRRLAYLADDVITYEALREIDAHLVGESAVEVETRPVLPLDEVVEQAERREIENALEVTGGNRTRAAALLGINRRSLLRRLNKYGYAGGEE